MRSLLAALLLASSAAATAQSAPSPSLDDPRLQTVPYDPSRPAHLFAFPGANLTVMLLPGEQITQVSISDKSAFDVRITDSGDSLNIMAERPSASASLAVQTKQRRYGFNVDTSGGLAAYLVRFVSNAPAPPIPPPLPTNAPKAGPVAPSQYRVSGEQALRPSKMSDDGERTYIEWGQYQSLPAVFGVGPTGQEEVVDGYMRGGKFTIDRVYGEIVFRMDKKEARARRLVNGRKG